MQVAALVYRHASDVFEMAENVSSAVRIEEVAAYAKIK
jgi:hypothetical protein